MAYTTHYVEQEPARETVDAWPGTTVLEFGAPWCGHCISAQSSIEAVLAGRDDVRHLKIEDGRGKALGRSYRVKLWPSLIVLRDGEEVARVVRPVSVEQVREVLDIAG